MIKLPSKLPNLLLTLLIGIVGGIGAEQLAVPLPWLLGPLATTAITSVAGIKTSSSKHVLAPARTFLGVAIGASFTPRLAGTD